MRFCMKDLRELEFSVNSPKKSINSVLLTGNIINVGRSLQPVSPEAQQHHHTFLE